MTVTALTRPLRDPLGGRVDDQVAHQAVRQAQTILGLLRQSPPSLPLASIRAGTPPRVVLGFGLGADSATILARWLTDPSSRDFELHELAVVTGIIFSSVGQQVADQAFCVEDMSLTGSAARDWGEGKIRPGLNAKPIRAGRWLVQDVLITVWACGRQPVSEVPTVAGRAPRLLVGRADSPVWAVRGRAGAG